MRTLLSLSLLLGLCLSVQAQSRPQYDSIQKAKETAGPVLFDYDPDYQTTKAREREEFLLLKAQIDALQISETKRLRMIKDLYRGKRSKMLEKYLYASTEFTDEDID